jgi:hypothetical protein
MFAVLRPYVADPSGRAVQSEGGRPLDCSNSGIQFR